MDTQMLWLLAMSIATPIAGVVGFGIQLRQIKKARLENDKLQLEIAALRRQAIEAERRIVLPTNSEVQKITLGEVRFSRGDVDKPDAIAKPIPKLKEHLIVAAVIAIARIFLIYLAYDLYRIAAWLNAQL